VANFYRIHLKGWDVSAQKRLDWHAQEANEHLPSMTPDLVLQEHSSGRIIILDTKFTKESLVENQWSARHRSAVGILLYPAVQNQTSERVQLQEHVIRIERLDLASAWNEVEAQLLRIVEVP
jgi:5-methylcytosine-specific restriction enzyme subunit McrC